LKQRGGRTWMTTPEGRHILERPRIDPVLVEALRAAHAMLSAGGQMAPGFPEAAELPPP